MMFQRNFLLFSLFLLFNFILHGQTTFPTNGIKEKNEVYTAITHATVITGVSANNQLNILPDATILVHGSIIVEVGNSVKIPSNTRVVDAKGKFIYPAFIDLYSNYGIPKIEETSSGDEYTQTKGAFGWNGAIHSDFSASSVFQINEEEAKNWRKGGFGTVLSHRFDGIVRGSGVVVNLGNDAHSNMLIPEAAAWYSFNKGSSNQSYPSSIMGSIALLRQTYCDANWYRNLGNKKTESHLTLEHFNALQSLPSFFDANDKWNVLRADAVGDEFGTQYIIKGNGTEYQRLKELKASGAALIVPINFPLPFDVSDPVLAKMISFGEMKHWEMAPSNAAKLFENQITFCLTSAGIEEKDSFLSSLRKAVQYGLPEGAALNALTASPAKLIRCENSIGKIAVGYRANFFMTNTSLFEPSSQILTSWIDGKEFFVSKEEGASKDGSMTLVLQDKKLSFEIEKQKGVYTGKLKVKHTDLPTDFRTSNDSVWINLSMNIEDEFVYGDLLLDSAETRYRFSGKIFNDMEFNGQLSSPLGQSFSFLGKFEPKQNKEENKKRESAPNLGSVIYPFTAYGSVELPKAENVIFRNATLWTCENGVVENGDLWIKDGKIAGIGKDFVLPKGVSCIEIDATGKHISPGIIDEHSHIALSSVNEGSQASSAEVEEGSVIYPEDIDIYRQLSGGTTASQLLHGSANPIGGQSALIKLKWGASAEEMKIKNAPGFIKFALGENVKQSNWGDRSTTRFPQTRMGVEQVYYDYFYRALEYGKAWEEYNAACKKTKKGLPMPLEPRRDLELETLYEILKKERFITCHSYVQSEINMLMHVADSFGFKINTFTHILEGYKVADKMKAHGAGASTFSDWWAYKAEVKDAIPYNAALMYEQGIVVAINSDDAEMGARLNQEAAKASKYGGVPKEEALKMVTLNPAKLLHLDDRMGSLKIGKDADFVIWSEEPLSIYARAEKTYIDGICYFDLKRDSELRTAFNLEREILIQKMLDAKNGGSATRQPSRKPPHHFHCDSMDETSRGIFIKE